MHKHPQKQVLFPFCWGCTCQGLTIQNLSFLDELEGLYFKLFGEALGCSLSGFYSGKMVDSGLSWNAIGCMVNRTLSSKVLFSLVNSLEWVVNLTLRGFALTRWAKQESQSQWCYSFGVCAD